MFQKTGYVKRQTEKNEPINDAYLDMFQKIIEDHHSQWDDPKSRENNMEWDLITTDWILAKARLEDSYAQNLYAAMCNNSFTKMAVIPILKDDRWSCSWRYAGGIVADMQQKGDYIDWYCSGMGGLNAQYKGEDETHAEWRARTKYVPEGLITDEIRQDLRQLGWAVAPDGDWENF